MNKRITLYFIFSFVTLLISVGVFFYTQGAAAKTPPKLPKIIPTVSTEILSRNGNTKEAYAGDSVRVTLVVKNVGEASATGLRLSLYCPKQTTLTSAGLNGKDKKKEALRQIVVPNLDKGATHRLILVCVIGPKVAVKNKTILKFAGVAYFKEGNRTRTPQSNTASVVVIPQPKKPKEKPKPAPLEVPFVPTPQPQPESLQAFPHEDLTTDSDFRF